MGGEASGPTVTLGPWQTQNHWSVEQRDGTTQLMHVIAINFSTHPVAGKCHPFAKIGQFADL